MDKYPLLCGGIAAGELTVTRDTPNTVFDAVCPRREGLWSVWAVGRNSALRIGIPEPAGDRLHICRRFSPSMVEPLGDILRGELRPPADLREHWEPLSLSSLPVPLHQPLRELRGILTCRQNGLRLVAIPRNDAAPFPLEAMFCFAQPRRVSGTDCWVFALDDRGWPHMP